MPRLDLLIAHNLDLSRGQVTRLCRAGRVRSLEGEPLKDPGLQIPPSALPRTILVDDEPHALHVRYHLLLHKHVGIVTALHYDRHLTAYELVRGAAHGLPLDPHWKSLAWRINAWMDERRIGAEPAPLAMR